MALDVQIESREKELRQIEKELEAEGVTKDTDIDEFLAGLEKQQKEAEAQYTELYAQVEADVNKAQEILRG